MTSYTNRRRIGFTIVELLVVVVVIAILATLAVVAYNGIQNRARSSTASTAARNARQQIEGYYIQNAVYPTLLSDVGIANTNTESYQYSLNASTGAYCVTATSGNISFFINNSTNTSPTSGGCAGHGQQGQPAITNFASNPSFELAPATNNAGAVTRSNPTVADAHSGTRVTRVVRNDTASSGAWWDAANPVTEGTAYTVCLYLRGTDPAPRNMQIEWMNSAATTKISTVSIQTISSMPTSWTRYCGTSTAPTGAGRLRLTLYGSGGVVGNYYDIDSVMITSGTNQYAYADGSSPNWVWNGAANSSTSTGPAL